MTDTARGNRIMFHDTRPYLWIGRKGNRRAGMKPLDQAIGDAFLEGGRRQGMAAGDVWDYVKW